MEQGVLGMDTDKYTFTKTKDGHGTEYRLTIRDLDDDDTALYGCIFCRRVRRRWICPYDFAFLHIVEDEDTIPQICNLVTGTNGVFFVEDDLILDCPVGNIQVSFNQSDVTAALMSKTERDRVIYQMKLVDARLNDTMISCVDIDDPQEADYCEGLPTILVFSSLKVKITPQSKEIPEGGNISFTCKSIPNMASSVEWNLPETDIMFNNITIIETTEGLRLTIGNIDFRNSSESSFEVTCNVTIGSQNAGNVATLYREVSPDKITTSRDRGGLETTPLTTKMFDPLENGTSERGSTTASTGNGNNQSSSRITAIVVPAVVMLVVLCVLVVIVVCVISSKNTKHTGSAVNGKATVKNEVESRDNAYQMS